MTAAPEATRMMLANLWERNLPVVQGRVDELQHVAEAASDDQLTTEARTSAEATAHKLAGSLGMFGYKRGTELAREMEQMLEGDGRVDASRIAKLVSELRAELAL